MKFFVTARVLVEYTDGHQYIDRQVENFDCSSKERAHTNFLLISLKQQNRLLTMKLWQTDEDGKNPILREVDERK